MSVIIGSDRMKSPASTYKPHLGLLQRKWSSPKCFTSSLLLLLLQLCYLSLPILLVVLQATSVATTRRSARIQYKTTYACEHRELQLNCKPNESIHLVRANYGRFSLSICNEGGRLDLSVMCMSYRSFLIMTDRCSNKSNCSVIVSSKLFGDPCPGTAKYLEVQYHCVRGGTEPPSLQSTQKPSEHLAINLLGNASGVNYPIKIIPTTTTISPNSDENTEDRYPNVPKNLQEKLLRELTVSEPTIKVPLSDFSISSKPTSTEFPLVEEEPEPEHEHESRQVLTSTSYPVPPANVDDEPYSVAIEDFCPSVFMRSLFWNWTQKGEVSTQKCPGGAAGYVSWQCIYNPELRMAEWYPSRPDFRECRSLWLDKLEERLNVDELVLRIAQELSTMTLTKPLYSDDLQRISRILQQFLQSTAKNLVGYQPVESWHRHGMVKDLLVHIVDTISNLLGNAQDDAWLDLSVANRKEVASSLIRSLETGALLLAENTNHDGSSAIAKANVLVSVHVLDTRMPISLQFPTLEDISGTNEWTRIEDSISLPAQSLIDRAQNGLAKVAFFAYYRIEDLLKPFQQTDYDNYNTISTKLHNYSQHSMLSINSRVIGAAMLYGVRTQNILLSQPVTIVLRHIQDENISTQKCVYWNNERQNWLSDGCWVEATNMTHTKCMCNHLTHFALLSEIKSPLDSVVEIKMERMIAMGGCLLALSIAAFASILIFTTPTGSTVSSAIHRNLCVTLLLSEAFYMCTLLFLDNAIVFSTGIALLHYCMMCSFFWTFFESFDIYMNVNSIYEHFKSSKRLYWYYMLAYFTPGLICLCCFIIDTNSYRQFPSSWLKVDNYLYLALVGPTIALTLASLVFILIVFALTRNSMITAPNIKCFEDIRIGSSKSLILWVLLLVISQAANWLFVFVYLSKEDSFTLAVLFALCNVWISIFICLFCILKIENVQHSGLFRRLPCGWCQEDPQLSSSKNSTTSDVYSTRPVVTQVTSTQSQSTHWNYPQEIYTKSIIQDPQSTSVQHQDPSYLLHNLNHTQTKTLPREFNNSFAQEFIVSESDHQNLDNVLGKANKRNKGNFEFASLHRLAGGGGMPRKITAASMAPHENKHAVKMGHTGMQPVQGLLLNMDHIYESIDSESISSTLYEQGRRQNLHNFYGLNYRSKSTVNDDDLSSSSIYEDKPLLLTNSSIVDSSKSKRIFIPQHYHSNASIYDKALKDKAFLDTTRHHHNHPSQDIHAQQVLWQLAKEPHELPDLIQKSNGPNSMMVSYSGENRFLNKVINTNHHNPKSTLHK